MLEFRLLTFLIILSTIKDCSCFLTNKKKDVIESLNKELNIKHLSIIKDLNFQKDRECILFIKRLSREKVYTSVLSFAQMNRSMYEDYYTPKEYYFQISEYKNKIDFYKNKANRVYPPKTMILLYGENLQEFTKIFFQISNEIQVTKYIWLIVDNFNESNFNSEDYYIPFNSELLLLKDKQDGYFLEEFYYPSIDHPFFFSRNFGIWEKSKGLEIFEPDIYKRRLDMNGTIIKAFHKEGEESYIQGCNNLKITECYRIREFSRILNFKLIVSARHDWNSLEENEMVLASSMFDDMSYYPFIVGPVGTVNFYIQIAYDEKFKKKGTSQLLSPFSFELWLAIAAWIGISTVYIIIIQYVYNKSNIMKMAAPCWEYIYEPLESFLNQCGRDPPNKAPFLILTGAMRLAALFKVPAYTGAILSIILTSTTTLPFKDLKGFVDDGSYRFGYLSDYMNLKKISEAMMNTKKSCSEFNTLAIFEMSYDINLKIAYEKFSKPIPGSFYTAALSGVDKMCEDHKFALLFHNIDLQRDDCEVIKIPSPVFSGWAVMKLRYGSPYMKIFNRILNTLKSSGVMVRMELEQVILGDSSVRQFDPAFDELTGVEIKSLVSIFVTIGILYITSIITLICEIIVNKINARL